MEDSLLNQVNSLQHLTSFFHSDIIYVDAFSQEPLLFNLFLHCFLMTSLLTFFTDFGVYLWSFHCATTAFTCDQLLQQSVFPVIGTGAGIKAEVFSQLKDNVVFKKE